MTADPIRWGILSTGHIAGVFAADLRLLPDHQLTAVASRTAAKAGSFAAEFGDSTTAAYGSYEDLAADSDVDIVYIATPHSEHHANARMCLDAGQHVLCEKAITVNAAECEDLIGLGRDRGLLLMEAMWMRTNPLQHRMVELVRDGAIGDVGWISATLGFATDPDPVGRMRNPDLAGGALLDMGVYPLAFVWQVLGAPLSVTATSIPSGAVDGTTGIVLGYENAVATVSTSLDVPMPPRGVVSGTKGSIVMDGFHAARSMVLERDGHDDETFSVTWPGGGYTYEAEEAARCVRAGLLDSPMVPQADSLAIMRTLDEIRAQIGLVYPRERPGGERA